MIRVLAIKPNGEYVAFEQDQCLGIGMAGAVQDGYTELLVACCDHDFKNAMAQLNARGGHQVEEPTSIRRGQAVFYDGRPVEVLSKPDQFGFVKIQDGPTIKDVAVEKLSHERT